VTTLFSLQDAHLDFETHRFHVLEVTNKMRETLLWPISPKAGSTLSSRTENPLAFTTPTSAVSVFRSIRQAANAVSSVARSRHIGSDMPLVIAGAIQSRSRARTLLASRCRGERIFPVSPVMFGTVAEENSRRYERY